MTLFDFVIIGAGAAGEAAAGMARKRGASVAVIERDLVGGSCAYWACIPSKSLLHSAAVHRAGGDYPWARASARRDYMINRGEHDERPDDSSRERGLRRIGAELIRGDAEIEAAGVVVARTADGDRRLETRNVVIATGSTSRIPELPGLADTHPWTNREATATRELPRSLIVLGGGPSGVELAQVFARYDVPVTVVDHHDRLSTRDHPRNADAIAAGLRRDGVTLRTGVRAVRVHANAAADGAHLIDLDDGGSVTGHQILLAVGRAFALEGLGLERLGFDPATRDGVPHDGRLRIAEGLWLIGDPAGPELHTHVSHYQGELAVRMALGEDVRPDYRALPRATYTDPEAAFVGVNLEEAQLAGIDAFERVAKMATSTKGYALEADLGHVTIVVDRGRGELIGAAIAGPGAAEAIHEATLAIKTRTPMRVLADTIHAVPTTARVMGGLFVEAAAQLGEG